VDCFSRKVAEAHEDGLTPPLKDMTPQHIVELDRAGSRMQFERALAESLASTRDHAVKSYAGSAAGAGASFGNATRVRQRMLRDSVLPHLTDPLLKMLHLTQGKPVPATLRRLGHVVPSVVIDLGSYSVKAGFAGDSAPTVEFPTVIGRPKNNFGPQDDFVGHEAMQKGHVLKLGYPIQKGVVKNWEDAEAVLHQAFKELKVHPEEYKVLVTETSTNPKENREKLTEMMFKKFDVPAFYVSMQATLGLFASGRTTGLVVDSGHDTTSFVPIYEGYALHHAVKVMPVGGRHVSEQLESLLERKDHPINLWGTNQVARDIKEKLGYVALDFRRENSEPESYKLPSGITIQVGRERFEAAEVLFAGYRDEKVGMAGKTTMTIQRVDVDIRKDMCSTIVLTGGSTMFKGLPERLEKEVKELHRRSRSLRRYPVKVHAPPNRVTANWLGGAILTNLATFGGMWISKGEFDDHGPPIVNRKCF